MLQNRVQKERSVIMTSTNAALRQHLSNIIYIDNGFNLGLFRSTPDLSEQSDIELDEEIVIRKSPAAIEDSDKQSGAIDKPDESGKQSNEKNSQKRMTVENFFGATQDYAPDLNILPYYYDPAKFWSNIDSIKQKLSHPVLRSSAAVRLRSIWRTFPSVPLKNP